MGKAKGSEREKQKVGVVEKSSKLYGVAGEEHTVGDSSRKNNENETKSSLRTNSVVHDENGYDEVHNSEAVEVKKKKKKKPQENGAEKQDRMKKNRENDDNHSNPSSMQEAVVRANKVPGDKEFSDAERADDGVEKQDKKKKKKNQENDDTVNADNVLGDTRSNLAEKGPHEVHNSDGVEVNKKRKEKSREGDEIGVEKQDRKKKKKKNQENDENRSNPSSVQDPALNADHVLGDKESNVAEKGPHEVHNSDGVEVNKKRKKKSRGGGDEIDAEKQDRKKKKKKKNQENDDMQDTEVNANTVRVDKECGEAERAETGPDEVHDNEGPEANKKKKKKSKVSENVDSTSTPNKSNKKVRFSDQDEVFPVPSESHEQVENLVIGKRFTPEEDSIVEKAVYDYIEEHGLGEEGLEMVLNCSKHGKIVKGCWKEIAKAIPYRPYGAIYCRAQILFRRSETRSWTQEEYDMVLKHQELNGNQWKALADELGKHHWHVKDAYRRIKLPNRRKGHWSQKEYQNLFDLVNADLQLKISEEKKSKHGMLRDNICWSGISDRMETRAMAPCCMKWYSQLTSPMVAQGVWADVDDYRLIAALYSSDENCMEDVDWDNLVEGRSGDLCRKRWSQMKKHIGHHGKETFSGQVEVLAQRYCPHLVEAREAWDSKPVVDKKPVAS